MKAEMQEINKLLEKQVNVYAIHRIMLNDLTVRYFKTENKREKQELKIEIETISKVTNLILELEQEKRLIKAL